MPHRLSYFGRMTDCADEEQRAPRIGGILICVLVLALSGAAEGQEKEPAMVNLPNDVAGQPVAAGRAAAAASEPVAQATSAGNVDLGSAPTGASVRTVRTSTES